MNPTRNSESIKTAYLLQQLLSDSAKKYPNKYAVVYKDSRIKYKELDILANKLACILRKEGVKSGDRIGICMNKSSKSIISIFGILKAGCAYVPIDPALPPKRLAYIIKDCTIKHLISSHEKVKKLEDLFASSQKLPLKSVIFTDIGIAAEQNILPETMSIPWEMVERSPELENPIERINNTDLAYILYTSGSTGIPKGVMISHLAALTFIDWAYHCFKISQNDVVSNHAPLHFDLSIFDIFTTIKAGGTIVLVPETTSTFPVTLTKFIVENKITIWYSVPSALILLLTKGNLEKYKFPDLRLILFAGEIFPVKYLRRIKQVSQARLYNLYGPTETNVCTFYEVKDIPPDQVDPVPIGKAIDNYDVFAVNNKKERIHPGETGELYARGPGLMLGYWGDPKKTRGTLISDFVQHDSKEKIYRTGDIVKIDKDENYIYVGRIDSMIKSRGHRIELGEIETTLYSHPLIKEAAVVAVPDDEITNRLKAFIVSNGPNALTVSEIQKYCRDRIPIYMVPETVEFRESFPKTSTGKINRALLNKG